MSKKLRKTLVLLLLLVSSYILFNTSYHLIGGTGEATAATETGVLEEEYITDEPVELFPFLSQLGHDIKP